MHARALQLNGGFGCDDTALGLPRLKRPMLLLFRYYRDRLSVPRGPCNISVLRECWVHGVIDDGTLVWGQGLIDWLPVKNVRTLVPQIRTVEGIRRSFSLHYAMQTVKAEAQPYFQTGMADWHGVSCIRKCMLSCAIMPRGSHKTAVLLHDCAAY